VFSRIVLIFIKYIGGNCNAPEASKEDYRVILTKNINHELDQDEFLSRSKDGSKKVFVRDRTFSIKGLIFLIMSLNRAVQRDLDSFFQKIRSSDYTIREATKGAFSQARSKLGEWGFIRLNKVAAETFYKESEYHVRNGHRLLSADGTRLVLPNHGSIKEEFGECSFGPKKDSKRSMAICSMLYDVLNHITLDARLAPFKSPGSKKSSESSLLQEHMSSLSRGDLLLLDRGYPSIALFFQLMAMGVYFCVRMKGSWWKAVREFRESPEKERVVSFSLPEKDRKKLSGYPGWADRPIKCRLVKVALDSGETEILCTSLIDPGKYPNAINLILGYISIDVNSGYLSLIFQLWA